MPSYTGDPGDASNYELDYRFNGGATHRYHYTAAQLECARRRCRGADLGDEQDRIRDDEVPTGGYMPTVYNIDLLVAK